jgi:hypothetical protein
MALSLGSALASKVYLGATEVALAYLGATQVYSSSAFSAEAQNYFDRLDAAGDTTYVDYKQPLANYIDGLVTLGGAYWDTMSTAASFVGVGIQGVTVPLRSGMPVLTNNFFIAGDLDQLRGLKGDGSTKWLSTGFDSATLGQDDYSISCYVTQRATLANNYLVGGAIDAFIAGNPNAQQVIVKNRSNSGITLNAISVSNFHGSSRTVSTEFDVQINGQSLVAVGPSRAPFPEIDAVFSRSSGQNKADGRIAAYHIGPAINLLPLEALQDTLLSEVAEAQFSAEAANYFSRLAVAGDTTHYAYRQPLANYIDSLVTLGGAYWDTMKSAASFVGVGIQGITVPLRDGMPVITENNFVAGDLNQVTGLKGDGSLKYLDTQIVESVHSQNNVSTSVYVTELYLPGGGTPYSYSAISDGTDAVQITTIVSKFYNRCVGFTNDIIVAPANNSLIGVSRSIGTEFKNYAGGLEQTNVANSSPFSGTATGKLFTNINASSSFSSPRLATYHLGPALDLATLEALQDTLITEIAAI